MRPSLIFFFGFAILARAEEPAAGRWEGSIQIPDREIHVTIDLAQESGGAWRGAITSPDVHLKSAALSDINANGSDLSFAIKTALADQRSGPAKFNGRLAPDGKLAGDFVLAGTTAPFSLRKTGAPQVEADPRSTAVSKELEGEWYGGYELFGYPRKVTIKLQNRGAEGATAEFTIVGRKENKLPVDLVTQNGEYLTIDSHETGLSFEGRVGKGEIKGLVLQGLMEIPVVLKRDK